MNEIIDSLITIFTTGFTTIPFTTYFKGKQDAIAEADMPMLQVYPKATRQKRSGTVRDQAEYDIVVEVVINAKTYWDMSAGQGSQLDVLEKLVDLVEERESDGDAKAPTVFGILNNNLTASSKVLYIDNLNVEYSTYLDEGGKKGRATVTFTAYDRPNRT